MSDSTSNNRIIIETSRLVIERGVPSPQHIELVYDLWTCPEVMKYVGFPQGLKTTKEEIAKTLSREDPIGCECILIVSRKEDKTLLGHCFFHKPDPQRTCETDIKLLPQYHGAGYGTEIKKALIDYVFTHTSCRRLKATPNINNIKSCRMQEKSGFYKAGKEKSQFPSHMKDYTTLVEYYIYYLEREAWEKREREAK